MTQKKQRLLAAGIILLVPCTAWANGWNHVQTSSAVTLVGVVIGCLVGLAVAVRRHSHAGRLFAWTIGVGVAIGLGSALLSIGADAAFFIPNNEGIGAVIAVSAILLAAGGGAILAALAVGIRSVSRRHSGRGRWPPQW